jgi:hypothetical protein
MRRGGSAADPPVVKTTTVVIDLRVEDEGTRPSGEIRSRSGSAPFAGWVGLFAALHRLLAEARDGTTENRKETPLDRHDHR